MCLTGTVEVLSKIFTVENQLLHVKFTLRKLSGHGKVVAVWCSELDKQELDCEGLRLEAETG